MNQRAKDFTEAFDDLPDGAFFALAEEQGIDILDFVDLHKIETDDELDTLKALHKLKIQATCKNSSSFQLITKGGSKVMYYTPKRSQNFIYSPQTGKKYWVKGNAKIKSILLQIDEEQSC